MTIRSFWLKPYVSFPGPLQIDIVGRASRTHDLLTLSYELLGDIGKMSQSEVLNVTHRTAEVWQLTHLKCFVAPVGASHYWAFQWQPIYDWVECFSPAPSAWDFRISPSHDWTVLRYEDYRQNPRPDHDIQTASYSLISSPQALNTLLKIDLCKVSLGNQPLKIGLCAITKLADGHTNHWALDHPEDGPDFHHSQSFALPI